MSRQSNPDAAPQIDDTYELLTTIKFDGSVIKPPAIIQLSDAEAAPLIAKGYISASKVLAPKHVSQDETGDVDSDNPTTTQHAAKAGEPQQDQVAAGGAQGDIDDVKPNAKPTKKK